MPWRQSLTFAQIQSVLLVHETGSVQAAADRMALSASQVSRNLAAVEREFGHPFFVRFGPTMRLTPFGGEVLPRMAEWFDLLEPIIASGEAVQHGTGGRLRLGYTSLTAFTELPRVLQLMRSRFPDVQLELSRKADNDCAHAVAEGRLDAALISPPVVRKDLQLLDLGVDPLALAVPAAWSVGGTISLDDVRLHRIFVAPWSDWPGTLQLVLARCEATKLRPQFQETVNDAIGRMVLALAHDAAALVSMVRAQVGLSGIQVVPVTGLGDLGFHTAFATPLQPSPAASQCAMALAEGSSL